MHKGKKIMGIINLNDDSFYAGSRIGSVDEFLTRIQAVIDEGGDIIDIGACSSRPGSDYCGEDEEWKRLKPYLQTLAPLMPQFMQRGIEISIDTFKSRIVRMAHDVIGRFIINDISAGEDDAAMLPTVGELGLTYIAMHKRGNSRTMDSLCSYKDVVVEVYDYFKVFEAKAKLYGIDNWILDPGFGFSKNIEQNLDMLSRLETFKSFNRPLLVGISRKRMTYMQGGKGPEDALEETTRLHRIALSNGADILRVHDVGAAVACLKHYNVNHEVCHFSH